MADHDDDLTMESTTDSPEQIAEGLGVELSVEDTTNVVDDSPVDGPEALEEGAVETDEGEEPAVEVTPDPTRQTAPKARASRPQPKRVSGAAAAARRESEAKLRVAETERDAALARIQELTAPIAKPAGVVAREEASDDVAVVPVLASAIPDTHPEVAAALAAVAALGSKPKQDDFPDFEAFEDKRDTWIEDRARLKMRADLVREDVARRLTNETAAAKRAALATKTSFDASVVACKTRHADYDAKVAAAKASGVQVSEDIGKAVIQSPIGADVHYYLIEHPEEITRLQALSPHRQVAEIGMIEGRIAASIRPGVVTNRPVARTTRAPEPQRHTVGDLPSAGGKTRDEEMNDPATSRSRYNELRDEMDVESGRRVRTH